MRMIQKIKYINLIVISFMILFNRACGQRTSTFPIAGTWKVSKRIAAEAKYKLTNSEMIMCNTSKIVFRSDSIISTRDSCFYGYSCSSPKYVYKKVNAKKYFEEDTTYLERIGFNEDSILVINTSCGLPFSEIYVLNSNLITVAENGYFYFLKRERD